MIKIWKFVNDNILKFGIAALLIFIPIYPKLPSLNIPHTWVYVRLEDFLIALVVLIWLLKLILGRMKPPSKVWIPFVVFWAVGLLSLIFSLVFLAPHLANFFPNVAVLFYLRHIEYMILFFVAFSTIKSREDLRHYLIIICVSVLLFSIYAFGQRFYLNLWHAFPDFFKNFSFCFPSFQTGNEEFAKGIPLCLPKDARITSTFAGHYDLAAYMVLIIPIFVSLIFTVRKNLYRVLAFGITLTSIMVLIFTASRISFLAYLLAITITLVMLHKKKFIIPFYILSIILLLVFSGSTAKRFMETFRLTSVVTNNQGQVVGEEELPDDLKKRLAENILANEVSQNLPGGSGFLGLPQLRDPTKTDRAIVRSALSIEEAKRLQLENGGVEISTVSGSFLIKKVLVYDISFTTRFQAEWPNAWGAMLRNPLLGSGYATITLAADNNFLRILGETGLLGLFSFLSIFIIIFIIFRQFLSEAKDSTSKGYIYAIVGGTAGLFFNAVLIDVFEASKVAETFWILLGIAVGVAFLYKKDFQYKKYLKTVLLSRPFIFFYLLFVSLVFYLSSFKNFFVADDLTWLKWAATTNLGDLPRIFIDSQGFFYRPLDKIVMYFLYTFFSFGPQGYHVFNFVLHFAIGLGLYLFVDRLFKNKLYSFIAAFVFLYLPSSFENVFWISTISINLCTFFIVYSLLSWLKFRDNNSKFFFILSILLGALAIFSHEMGVVFPFLIILADGLLLAIRRSNKIYLQYVIPILLIPFYFLIRTISNTVAVSGDYSYNVSHLIPNFLGNFAGYVSFMLLGEGILDFYTKATLLLREEPLYLIATLILAGIISFLVLYSKKETFKKLLNDRWFQLVSFSILFIFIALTPFLGLGNIAPRYTYLSSFGFALLVLIVLQKAFERISSNYRNYALFGALLIIGVIYFIGVGKAAGEWREASRITNRTLAYLRLYYDGKRPNSSFYFANIPIKKGNAWVWPVGLDDGVWFIYRDDTIRVYKLDTLEDAKNKLKAATPDKKYIFSFDKNGNIYAIK